MSEEMVIRCCAPTMASAACGRCMTTWKARSGSLPGAGTAQRCTWTAFPGDSRWTGWQSPDEHAIHDPARDWNRPQKERMVFLLMTYIVRLLMMSQDERHVFR